MKKTSKFALKDEKGLYFWPLAFDAPLTKFASVEYSPETSEFVSTIKPEAGFTYVLINALSAYEYWGCNLNGDAFKEEEFTVKKRHQTFVSDGHPYRQHVNKDPKKSYGKILAAFYNPRMHRVELICKFEKSKAQDICDKIDRNEDVRVSMGCRVAYDVCSICGNKARTKEEYCAHIKNQLKQILPDGRLVCMFNENPTFFDISVVWIPADRVARVMRKIASVQGGFVKHIGEIDYDTDEETLVEFPETIKTAAMQDIIKTAIKKLSAAKLADIRKDIDGEIMKRSDDDEELKKGKEFLKVLRDDEPELPKDALTALGGFPIDKVLASLGMLGMFLKPREFQRVSLIHAGLRNEADMFDNAGIDFEPLLTGDNKTTIIIVGGADAMRKAPKLNFSPEDLLPSHFLRDILPHILGSIGEKSYLAAPVTRRLIRIRISGPREKRASTTNPLSLLSPYMRNLLMTLAMAYLSSKTGLLEALNKRGFGGGHYDEFMRQNPEVATAILGAFGTLPALAMRMSQGPDIFNDARPSDFLYAKQNYQEKHAQMGASGSTIDTIANFASRVGNAFEAPAASKPWVSPGQASLITKFTIPQLAAGLTSEAFRQGDRDRAAQGDYSPRDLVTGFMRDNPGKTGLILTYLSHRYGVL